MADYSSYVHAVYGIALLVYGGLILTWQQRLRRVEGELALREKEGQRGGAG
ncbi:MAG: hypothetical protein HQL66_13835 [Magnetococcales bacterium]|nr:hypothetical protein [Magnetococcales bacterium]